MVMEPTEHTPPPPHPPSARPQRPSRPATPPSPTPSAAPGPAAASRIAAAADDPAEAFARHRREPRRFQLSDTAVFAIAVSLFVHMVLMLWLAVAVRTSPQAGQQGPSDLPLAVLAEADLSDTLEVGLTDTVPTPDAVAETEFEVTDAYDDAIAESELSSLDTTDLGDIGGAGDVDAAGGGAIFGGGGGGARFFGVEAQGSRFAYIIDVSGSMQGERMTLLKRELRGSIAALLEHTHFNIVLYNSEAFPLSGDRWLPGTERYKRLAFTDIGAIAPTGGTDPLPAFEAVFELEPRPDAIYFMTDGNFWSGREPEFIARVIRLNNRGSKRAAIHCITLVEDRAASMMQELARRSRGSYTHISAQPPETNP
jgi:hypothetical protein